MLLKITAVYGGSGSAAIGLTGPSLPQTHSTPGTIRSVADRAAVQRPTASWYAGLLWAANSRVDGVELDQNDPVRLAGFVRTSRKATGDELPARRGQCRPGELRVGLQLGFVGDLSVPRLPSTQSSGHLAATRPFRL